jgi:hypothetical protein
MDNTIMKMACKRALVAATLNATAASDIFTQDVEDMPQGTFKQDTGMKTGNGKKAPPADAPKAKGEEKKPEPPAEISEVKKSLHAELSEYCIMGDGTTNMDLYKDTLETLSRFTGKNAKGEDQEYVITDLFNVGVSDKWAGKVLGALRKMIKGRESAE